MTEGGSEKDPFLQLAEAFPDDPADIAEQVELLPADPKAAYTPQSGTGNPEADFKAWDPIDQTFDF